jgi:hypothetical protein
MGSKFYTIKFNDRIEFLFIFELKIIKNPKLETLPYSLWPAMTELPKLKLVLMSSIVHYL